uniref:Btz domain-containing protein n=1 Tax=Zea mays TaxID=4577 RepID=A0A804NZB9_MAIZE
MVNTRRLWSPKDEQAWVHDRFDVMDMHDFHGDNARTSVLQLSASVDPVSHQVKVCEFGSARILNLCASALRLSLNGHQSKGNAESDNVGVIVNPKGDMKGFSITGPIGKECADLWPRIASAANAIV